MSGWRTIESAPKNTGVLLYIPENEKHYAVITTGSYCKHNHVPIYGWCRVERLGEEEMDYIEPSHWMELPEPPK